MVAVIMLVAELATNEESGGVEGRGCWMGEMVVGLAPMAEGKEEGTGGGEGCKREEEPDDEPAYPKKSAD